MEYDISKIYISHYIIYNEKLQKYMEYNYFLKYIMVQKIRVNNEFYYARFGDNKIVKQINPSSIKNGKIYLNYDNFFGLLCFGKTFPIYSYTADEERETGLITRKRIEDICYEVNSISFEKKEQKNQKILKFRPIK